MDIQPVSEGAPPKENPAGSGRGSSPKSGRSEDGTTIMALASVSKSISPPVSIPPAVEDVVGEGRLVVTPQFARQVLATANYDRQRPIRAPHVSFLADEMRRGNFVPGTQLTFAKLGDKLILVNGQHRLTAQAVCEATVEYQVLIQVAATMSDVARYYYRQDRGGRARSDAEVLAAIGVASDYGLSASFARSVFRAVPLINNRFLRPNLSTDPTLRNDDLRLEACKPWWPVAESFEYIVKPAPSPVRSKLASSQAVAVALVTLHHQPEKARQFWEGVAKDDGLRRNDPRKALLIDFTNREWGIKTSDGCLAVSHAWNAFFAGRSISHIKIHPGAPVRIDGTPYNGRVA